jgi:tRNA threonylcarbamoyladenosine biosynthesis protein TsaB
MVLLIDTSSACAGIAVLGTDGQPVTERVVTAGPGLNVAALVRELVEPAQVTRIGVATGPGSFTGLRVGVAFALGLAMSRRIPIHGLPTLEVAAARANEPATAVAEAGRGRLYFQAAGAAPQLGVPAELPQQLPVVGWLRDATEAAVRIAGRRLLAQDELRSFAEAGSRVIEGAPELPYGRVKIEYMQSLAVE